MALGAAIWQSSAVDGKLDPSQPDVAVGPVGASPEIGTGAIKVGGRALETEFCYLVHVARLHMYSMMHAVWRCTGHTP